MEKLNVLQTRILLYLDRWHSTSAKHLADMLGVSDRTVRNIINTMNDTLSFEGVHILMGPRTGCVLEITDQNLYQRLIHTLTAVEERSSVLPERVQMIHAAARMILCSDENVTPDFLAAHLYTNISTIKKIKRQIANIVNDFHLSLITKKQNRLQITGNESDIRIFLNYEYRYFQQSEPAYQDEGYADLYFFSKEEVKKVEDIIIESQIVPENYNLSQYSVEYIATAVLICRERQRQGHFQVSDENTLAAIANSTSYLVALRIMRKAREKLHYNFEECDAEFITKYLSSLRIMKHTMAGNSKNFLRCYNTAVEMIEYIARINNYPYLNQDVNLVNEVSFFLMSYEKRVANHIITNQFMYPAAFSGSAMAEKMALQGFLYIYQEKHLPYWPEDIIRLSSLFQPVFGHQRIFSDKLKICVISSVDQLVGKATAEELKRNFPNLVDEEIDVKEPYELDRCDPSQYDGIITSYGKDALPVAHPEKLPPVYHMDVFSMMQNAKEFIRS